MIIYLLKSSACLALFLGFYVVFLEREKMHQFNRFYLIGSVLISLIAPLLLFETVIYIEEMAFELPQISELRTQSAEINYGTMIWNGFRYIWFSISILLLIRFAKNIHNIYRKIKGNQKENIQNATLVLVDEKISPHTFLKYIFIYKKEYEKGNVKQELLTHELTHVTEKHSIDVIAIELLKLLFWFNPLWYLMKKTIQLNHEFIADSKVIHLHKNISEYQHLLVNKATWKNTYYLASNLNYLLTKKRLIMMQKETSTVTTWLKRLTVFPLVICSIYAFSDHIETYKSIEKENQGETRKDTLRATLTNGEEIKVWEVVEENNDLSIYQNLYKQYETLRNIKPHYVKSELKRKEQLDALFSELGSIYFNLSKKDKKKVNRPIHPFKPYVKLTKNKKVFYKLRNKLTKEDKLLLPPPPPKQSNNKHQNIDSIPQKNQHLVVNKKDKTFSYKNKTGKIITKKFSELTEKEKKMMPPPPPKIIPKQISKTLYNKIKQEKNYAVWIDGKPVKNKVLNNYSNIDFIHYSNSFVHKNARSRRFPQQYQISLYTKQSYNNKKKESKSKWKVDDKIKLVEVNNVSNTIQKKGKTRTYFFENKKISKKQFYMLIKNNKSYVIGSAYKNNVEEMYVAQTEKKLLELIKK